MIEKKTSKGDLDRRKITFLLIGFVTVFILIYAAFELYATKNKPKNLGRLAEFEFTVLENDIVPTDPPKQQTQQELHLETRIVEVPDDVETGSLPVWPGYDPEEIIPDYVPIPIPDEPKDDLPVHKWVDEMPTPIGGYEVMNAFLKANLKYPELCREGRISGVVLVDFVVEKDGSICNVKVNVGTFPDLDQEAVRVVKMLPKWKPGKLEGVPVRCLYSIPIRFAIN